MESPWGDNHRLTADCRCGATVFTGKCRLWRHWANLQIVLSSAGEPSPENVTGRCRKGFKNPFSLCFPGFRSSGDVAEVERRMAASGAAKPLFCQWQSCRRPGDSHLIAGDSPVNRCGDNKKKKFLNPYLSPGIRGGFAGDRRGAFCRQGQPLVGGILADVAGAAAGLAGAAVPFSHRTAQPPSSPWGDVF